MCQAPPPSVLVGSQGTAAAAAAAAAEACAWDDAALLASCLFKGGHLPEHVTSCVDIEAVAHRTAAVWR